MSVILHLKNHKLGGMYSWPIFIGTSSIIHTSYFIDLSVNYNYKLEAFISPRSSLLHMEKGIKLMLSPKSHRALTKIVVPTTHGIEKLSRSLSFGANIFWITVLQIFSKHYNFIIFKFAFVGHNFY